MKKRSVLVTQCIELITEIVKNFWDYLPTELQDSIEDSLSLLLDIETEDFITWAEAKLSFYGKLSDISSRRYHFYCSISSLREAIQARLIIEEDQEIDLYEPKMMKCFLDFLVDDALSDRSKLVPYTKEMSARARGLIAGVYIDDD